MGLYRGEQDKIGYDKIRQNRIRQDKTGQVKTVRKYGCQGRMEVKERRKEGRKDVRKVDEENFKIMEGSYGRGSNQLRKEGRKEGRKLRKDGCPGRENFKE